MEPAKKLTNTHDLGFMLFCSFGQGFRLTANSHYLDVIREGYPTDEHKPNNWIPGRETDKFSIASLFDLLASTGENLLKIEYPKFFAKEYKTFEMMRLAAYQQGQSILLRDINLDNFKPLTTSLVKEKKQRNTKSTQK